MRRLLILLLMMPFVTLSMVAQERTITGTVMDGESHRACLCQDIHRQLYGL